MSCSASEDSSFQDLGTLWAYEVERAYGSGLCRSEDIENLRKFTKDLALQVEIYNNLCKNYIKIKNYIYITSCKEDLSVKRHLAVTNV